MDDCIGESIPKEEINLFSSFIKTFYKGDILMVEGDTDDENLFLIRKGTVGIYRSINGQNELITCISAVNFVGEMELIIGGPRIATVKAYSDEVVLYQFKHPNLETIVSTKEWGTTLLARLTTDLKAFSDKIIDNEMESRAVRQQLQATQYQLQEATSTTDKLIHNILLLLVAIKRMNGTFADQATENSTSWNYATGVNELIDNFIIKYISKADITDESYADMAINTLMLRNLLPEKLIKR
jgi:CRP-like cAMP-binding protein